MTWWTLEPRDPLMIRDGRPFGLDTEGARSLPFPTPSVVAGTVRSRVGLRRQLTDFRETLEIGVAGPLLVELVDGGAPIVWLPAPRDCVLFEKKDNAWPRYPLGPLPDWTDGAHSTVGGLRPIGAQKLPLAKPAKDAPSFWDLETFATWCAAPGTQALIQGRGALPHERRTHVAIDPDTGTGLDGKLFQTDGLRLTVREDGGWTQENGSWKRALDQWHRHVFLVGCEARDLTAGMVTLGGERRLSHLAPAGQAVSSALDGWRAPKVGARARVILLTPALFAEGAVPTSIQGARVVAAAVGRPLGVSGWDMAANGPKASRRCAPAGSVYWVELGDQDPAAWAARVHLKSISSSDQDCLDGFGLAAVGVWQ